TPSFIARRLQKVVVVKQCNPADISKVTRIAVPICTRQSLKGRYRSLGTRHYLGLLGLGLSRVNWVSIRQRFTNSVDAVRLGSGMTLRDNRLRHRRRTSSVNEIRARQRQRARKEMRASQRLRKYPATTPAINVIPATPPAIPNGNGATSWFPVGWSKFSQGAQTNVIMPAASTDVTMSAHVQLATTQAPPTLTGPTQTITPIGPTQATFMIATPAQSTAFAPTGIAPTIIPPVAPAASTQTALAPTAFVLPAAPVPSGIAQTSFSPAAAMPANPTQAAFGLSALAQAAAMSAAPAPTGLAQTTIATPAHNPPTTFVGQTGPTQFTSMPAVPTGPAPTGSAQATIPPAAPTGFAPTTTATASPASNGPSQAGLTLPPPTSTGPAPPATTFTFTSTSGSSRTQPLTNISVQRGSGGRGRQSGRLSNRSGKVDANQQARPAEPPANTYVYRYSLERGKVMNKLYKLLDMYGWLIDRRRRLGTMEATTYTVTIDRMYYALVYFIVVDFSGPLDSDELKVQLKELYRADDTTIQARNQEFVERGLVTAIQVIDMDLFEI
ncbi:hypothetical protein GGI16_006467, partial [Coemansia sp. S142-1]